MLSELEAFRKEHAAQKRAECTAEFLQTKIEIETKLLVAAQRSLADYTETVSRLSQSVLERSEQLAKVTAKLAATPSLDDKAEQAESIAKRIAKLQKQIAALKAFQADTVANADSQKLPAVH